MATNQFSVKVYYLENEIIKEIRKFMLDEDVATNYEYLMGKIKQYFVGLFGKDLDLFWKDGDHDYILISSDNELLESLKKNSNDACFKLYIRVKGSNIPMNNHHPGVVCDGCNGQINGVRYRCTICPDFDLCSSCESKQTHPLQHNMLCIKKPKVSSFCPMTFFPMGGFRKRCSSGMGRQQFNCPYPFGRFNQSNVAKETKEKENKSDAEGEPTSKEFIEQIASGFGLDPEVATSYAHSFFNQLNPENKSENTQEKSTSEEIDVHDQILKNVEQVFGIKPDVLSEMFKPLFEHCNGHTEQEKTESKCDQSAGENMMNVDETVKVDIENKFGDNKKMKPQTTQTECSSSNNQESKCDQSAGENMMNVDETVKVDIENKFGGKEKMKPQTTQTQCSSSNNQEFIDMANQFSNQMGADPESQDKLKNLSKMIGSVIQNMTANFNLNSANSDDSNTSTSHTEKNCPGGFVFVDDKNTNSEQTEAENFEKRLNESLHQMQTMGFDNDGDWLKQLLISKDLDISRVLDALNPPKV